jgi:molybdopterin/thiamine biosynthesis adenylyltransferase
MRHSMTSLNAMRHVEIHDPRRYAKKRVAVIGVGTIGSQLALTLARMQVAMAIYDPDTLEEHNIATQAYPRMAIGMEKINALLLGLREIGVKVVHAYSRTYDAKGPRTDVIVSCVDSLAARKEIASLLIKKKSKQPIIDGRVGREQVEVYYFKNAKEWLDQLPEVADTDPCGARFTAYTANIAAGLMAANIKRVLLHQERGIPQRIIFDARSYTFIKQ